MIPKLRANPFSHASIRYRDREPVELRTWSVTRSRGALTRNFARAGRADFDRICDIVMRGGTHGRAAGPLSIGDFVVLAKLGLWAAEPDLIDPLLIEAPIRPAAANPAEPLPADEFALRGEVWLQHGARPSLSILDAPLFCLSSARPILWHRGSPVEPALPWWPDSSCLAAIEAVQQGAPFPPDLWPSLHALKDQGILAQRTGEPAVQGLHRLELEAGRISFARDGFVKLGQLLPPAQLAAFQTYWRELAALGVLPQRGDKRQGSHGEPSATLLLHLLKPLVEHLIGAPIEPAFSYSWIYDRGAAMPAHRDRMEASYTMSFLIDYQPKLDGPTPWPLFIRPRGRSPAVEIRQAVGDALLFCGGELEHSRPPFTMGERSISLLLHYVDRNFAGKLF